MVYFSRFGRVSLLILVNLPFLCRPGRVIFNPGRLKISITIAHEGEREDDAAMDPDTDPATKVPESGSPSFIGFLYGQRILVTFLVGILCILAIVFLLTASGSSPGQSPAVPPSACAGRVTDYITNNLAAPGTSFTVTSVSDEKGVYAVKSTYNGQAVTVYTTRDCTLLFTNAIDMNRSVAAAATPPPKQPVRSSRPVVDLYVMSFCPYGTQAEQGMVPVEQLLGSKADFRIRFITTVSGTTIDSVSSLHGPEEAREDLRQVCIQANDPAHFWGYLSSFDDLCYPLRGNSSALGSCRLNVTATSGVDTTGIGTCISGAGGIALLKTDAEDAAGNGATASPTLLINGLEYSGARTPEAYKEAVCNSFVSEPAECNTTLASSQASATGGCG